MSEEKTSRHRLRSSSLTTVVSLSLVLFMLGLLGLAVLNTQKISYAIKERYGFQLLMSDKAKDPDIMKLQKILDAAPYVKSTQYLSKEEAAAGFMKEYGEDFIEIAGYNPIPATITVRVKAEYVNPDSLRWIARKFEENSLIKEVVYQKDLIEKMDRNMNRLAMGIFAFSILLMIVALALINNTIRLAIYSKRFIIKTMQLVGATRSFIRLPFILTGIKHGLYGAIAAIAMLIGTLYIAQHELPELREIQDNMLLIKLFSLVIVLGITIGGISTAIAVSKYLRLRTDELYY